MHQGEAGSKMGKGPKDSPEARERWPTIEALGAGTLLSFQEADKALKNRNPLKLAVEAVAGSMRDGEIQLEDAARASRTLLSTG